MREYQGIDNVGAILNPGNFMVLICFCSGQGLSLYSVLLMWNVLCLSLSLSLSFFFLPFSESDSLLMLILVSHLPYDIGVL